MFLEKISSTIRENNTGIILGKICKISSFILATVEIVCFILIADKLREPLFILAGCIFAGVTILFMFVLGEIVALLNSINSIMYRANYTKDDQSGEATNGFIENEVYPKKEINMWTCNECGSFNYQHALYCKNCGKYK